jgi:hypothetical protein
MMADLSMLWITACRTRSEEVGKRAVLRASRRVMRGGDRDVETDALLDSARKSTGASVPDPYAKSSVPFASAAVTSRLLANTLAVTAGMAATAPQ